jgi:N-acetylneuraminic acid mutarotase
MWEFDPVANSWARITDFPGTARYSAVAFSVGSKAYIGFGYDGQHRNDLWEFNPGEGK